jgi:hypothetical protein
MVGVKAVACLMFMLLWLGGAVAVNAAITQGTSWVNASTSRFHMVVHTWVQKGSCDIYILVACLMFMLLWLGGAAAVNAAITQGTRWVDA